jgi:hypothetical protein
MSEHIPDIQGLWRFQSTYLEGKGPFVKPSFSDIKSVEFNITVEQSGLFTIFTFPASAFRPQPGYLIGVWTRVYSRKGCFWQITISDFDDSGFNNYTIKEWQHGKPSILTGFYVESGYLSNTQAQTSSSVTMTKLA